MLKKAKKTKKRSVKKKPNLHFRRFEFKYILPRNIADRLIPELLNYTVIDENTGNKDSYEVNSLYFDSPHLKSYYEKIFGILNRKKMRIRAYDKNISANKEVYFELKRKSGEVILKDREIIDVPDFCKFIEDPFRIQKNEKYNQKFCNELLYEYKKYQMIPTVFVSYKRKPFFSRYNRRFRVTFDYELQAALPNNLNFDMDLKPICRDNVIMEVKFNGKLPGWFRNIIEEYRLVKMSYSKYCEAVKCCYNLFE
jgi:hypothetical protein